MCQKEIKAVVLKKLNSILKFLEDHLDNDILQTVVNLLKEAVENTDWNYSLAKSMQGISKAYQSEKKTLLFLYKNIY